MWKHFYTGNSLPDTAPESSQVSMGKRSWSGMPATHWKDSQRLLKDEELATFSSSVLAALTS